MGWIRIIAIMIFIIMAFMYTTPQRSAGGIYSGGFDNCLNGCKSWYESEVWPIIADKYEKEGVMDRVTDKTHQMFSNNVIIECGHICGDQQKYGGDSFQD